MKQNEIEEAVELLGKQFPHLNWNFRADPSNGRNELISQWLGDEDEEVMLCVFRGKKIHEQFHRQDFFFLNFALEGDYQALSARYDRQITVAEGDCYIGQPYSGYALRGESSTDLVIAGILIRRETFFNEFLGSLSSDPDLMHFFLEPKINVYSDEYIHLKMKRDDPVFDLLGIMLVEYAHKKDDSQKILKPLILSLLILLTRTYRLQKKEETKPSAAEEMIRWMDGHLDGVTLHDLAVHFGYHPNYVSALLHKETGSTFSEILLEKRMKRAVLLLKNTDLSQEKIADLVGYHNTSNFYKAFRNYYGESPKEYKMNCRA
jgi:AraC-like DNA-binding protein